MRVTNSMMVNRMMMNMNKNLGKMNKMYEDYATGKKIHRPSDDPVLVARSLKINTDIAENEQFKKNINDASSILDKTETSLRELNSVLLRVRELTTQASNGVLTKGDTQNIQAEVEQLKEQIIKISNDTYVGRHIYSGYKTDKSYMNENGSYNLTMDKEIRSDNIKVPFTVATPDDKFELTVTGVESADGIKTSEKYTVSLTNKAYNNTEELRTELESAINTPLPAGSKTFEVKIENNNLVITNKNIKDDQKFALKIDSKELQKQLGLETLNVSQSNEKIKYHVGISADLDINIRGDQVFGAVLDTDEDGVGDKTLMDTMNDLISHLEKGDTDKVSGILDEVDGHRENISRLKSEIGARSNTAETIKNRIEQTEVNFAKLLSETEDTDMAETSMNFMAMQSVYQASLNVGAKIIQPTLVDFIR
ncbi:flagellar hook-associated protein FlgL [Tepidibacter mesophilus]|uniref:flagellar hook-associated protein FlgL n=1 Tax=Tepidibacter mesophilus TaxID=655607 RepID=UPI000C08D299|nr:flagellar hook-associated protein FlgL [Tepidibacter mesophilus]